MNLNSLSNITNISRKTTDVIGDGSSISELFILAEQLDDKSNKCGIRSVGY